MKVSELTKILTALESQTPKGLSVFSIAKETDIEPQTIREYLSKHQEYFIRLPSKKTYQINRFGKGKGSVDAIIQHYEKELEAQSKTNYWWFFIVLISLVVTLSVTNG